MTLIPPLPSTPNIVRELSALLPVPEKTDGGWTAALSFPPSFSAFAGHFPGNPVVPAVVQILLLRCLVEKIQKRPVRIRNIHRAKFLIPLRPETCVALLLRQERTPGKWRGQLSTSEGVVAIICFEEEGDA